MAGLRTLPTTAAATEVQWPQDTDEITLFAFDQEAFPGIQNLKLEMREPVKHPSNPVVPRGGTGDVDSWAVQFYGSVIKVGTTYRMWYCASSAEERAQGSGRWRVAYAESADGVTWTKPNLGLVEFDGNADNNLVELDPDISVLVTKVLYEPDDPDPNRRYKMGCHVYWDNDNNHHGTLAVYGSADGLTWTSLTGINVIDLDLDPADLLLPALHAEPVGGLYKWKGTYYACGQNALPAVRPLHGRVARIWQSGDFETWQQVSTPAFVRHQQHTLLGGGRSRDGEQTHEGIAVWNRGNVLLGVYGMWHGSMDWADVTVDLGFVVSNDGLNFREPAHEFTFIERGGRGTPPAVPNRSFEDVDGAGWAEAWILDAHREQTADISTAEARSGTRSLRMENASTGTSVAVRSPKLTAAPGVEYEASVWALTHSGIPAQLFIEFFNDAGNRLGYQSVSPSASNSWHEVTVAGTAPAGTTMLDVLIYGANAATGVSFHDDASVQVVSGAWDQGGLLQGQGFEHVGDDTFIYYGAWDPRPHGDGTPLPPRGGVGIAVLPKDRFADLTVDLRAEGDGDYQIPEVTSEFITATIVLGANHTSPDFFVNAEGLGAAAKLRLELLEHDFTPIPGYSGGAAAVIDADGFRTPASFPGTAALPEKIRIRGYFDGADNTDIKLSAIYIA